jgi:hypothetical protein
MFRPTRGHGGGSAMSVELTAMVQRMLNALVDKADVESRLALIGSDAQPGHAGRAVGCV